ncbi:MAG: cytochrome B, partial [Paracoccaceae bacterium]
IDYQAAWVLGGGHLWLANILLFLITLHVAGALFESWRTRENLPRAMIDGMKERRAGDHAPDPVAARPLLAGTSIAAGLAIASLAGAAFAPRPAIGVPSGVLDPVYADECAACHVAFHPSLLSRSDWSALMETLEDHYGEDASLDTETSAAIKAWLVANASETADTRAAHVFRRTDPAHPFTITKTPFWVQRHAALDPALFTAKPVYSRANCPACHTDAAQGLFHPASISLPKESKK